MSIDLKDAHVPGEIPPGKYTAKVLESEIKDTKAGTGKYVQCKLLLEELSEHIWVTFNILNPNPEAVKIGKGQLKALLKAAGYENPDLLKDVWEMNGMRFQVKTRMKSDDFGDKCVVTSYSPLPGKEGETAAAGKPDSIKW